MVELVKIVCIFFLNFVFCSPILGKYTLKKVTVKKPVDGGPIKIFTSADLKQYDGSNPRGKIYMAVKGMVFDVTKGKTFYGPDSPYHALTAKDCTRAVAKMSLDPSDLNSNIANLDDQTLEGLDNIVDGTYLPKYPIVGYMDYLLDDQEILEEIDAHNKQEL